MHKSGASQPELVRAEEFVRTDQGTSAHGFRDKRSTTAAQDCVVSPPVPGPQQRVLTIAGMNGTTMAVDVSSYDNVKQLKRKIENQLDERVSK